MLHCMHKCLDSAIVTKQQTLTRSFLAHAPHHSLQEWLANSTEDDWTSAYFESDGEADTAASATAGPTADIANNFRDIEKTRRTRVTGLDTHDLIVSYGEHVHC